MATTITSKGQVTIPKPVRDALGVGPSQAVEFTLQPDGKVVVAKAGGGGTPSRFARLRGRATAGLTTEQILALTRGED